MTFPNIKKLTLNFKQHLALILSLHLVLLPLNLSALPTGQSVAAGTATFAEVASTLNITTSNKAIINYSTFNIGALESVNFIQPSSASVVLNRVAVGNPSSILGSLNANGNVFLLNPSGMFFGANSSINTNSFVASTLNLSDSDFLSGNFKFNKLSDVASSYIIQKGNITVSPEGFVILASPFVSSEGSIIAKSGNIVIGANDNFYLEFDSAGLVKYEYADATISDDPILISKEHASSVINSIINTDELDESIEFVEVGDSYELKGANNTALVSGTLNTDATDTSSAGTIEIKAQNDVFILDNATLQSNAKENGDGGTIDIYANDLAYSANNASYLAKGGSISGDGGFAELSATKTVVLAGSNINLSAQNGANGTFYIDPDDVVISEDSTFNGTDIEIVADNSITISDGVTISSRYIAQLTDTGEQNTDYLGSKSIGNSSNIILTAPNITLGEESQLLSFANNNYNSGDIILTATANGKSDASTSISLSGSFLKGGNIVILATASSINNFDTTGLGTTDDTTEMALDFLDDNLFSPVGYSTATANASINIENGTTIEAKSINIQSSATSEVSVSTAFIGLGIGYGESIANANTIIENGASLTSTGDINIGSTVKSINEVTVDTKSNLKLNLALAYATTETSSNTIIENGANIDSQNALTIIASTNKSISSKASASTLDTSSSAVAGVAAAISDSNSDTNASISGDIKAKTLSIEATILNEEIKTSSSSKSGSSNGVKEYLDKDTYAASTLTTLLGSKASTSTSSSKSTVGLSATLSYSEHSNSTSANIMDDANINIEDTSEIHANNNYSNNAVTSSAKASVKAENGASGAVVITELNNTTKAFVEDNVTLNSGGDITIEAKTYMPYEVEWATLKLWESLDSISSFVDHIKSFSAENIFFTTWAKSESKATNAGASGSVNIFNMKNDTQAYIGNNVEINKNKDTYGSLNLKASTDIETVNLSGAVSYEGNGLGGSYLDITYENNTSTFINGNSYILADDLSLISDINTKNISIAAAGAKADNYGIAGTYSSLETNNDTLSTIENSNIKLTDNEGDLELIASDDASLLNISGGVVKASSVGVGASVSFNDISRNTQTLLNNVTFNTKSDVTLSASNTGIINAYSVAGAVVSSSTPDEDSIQEGASSSGSYGLGISGASSVNEIKDISSSEIKNSSNIEESSDTKDITLSATNNSSISGVTGAASLSTKSNSAGIAGAYSQNTLKNKAITSILNSDLSSSILDLNSQNIGGINTISAGGTVTTSSSSAALAGSVSINEINNETTSSIEDSDINTKNKLSLLSYSNAAINTLAGAISLSTSAGVGAAFAKNDISNTSQSYIDSSDVTSLGKIAIEAKDESTINIIAAAIGVATSGMAAAGSVVINNIANSIEAYILGISKVDNEITASNGITLNAKDNSTINAYAGGLSAGSSAAVGATILFNTIKNHIKSYITDITVQSDNNIEVNSLSEKTINTIAIAGAVSSSAAASGVVLINTIKNSMDSYIENSTVNSDGTITIGSIEDNNIDIIAVSLAGSGTGAIGGILAINNISNNISAYANSSDITAKAGLDISSSVDEKIDVKLASLGGAGTGAIAGTVSINNINDTVNSYITKSTINKDNALALSSQDVSVIATSNDTIDSMIGSAAAGGAGGIGVSVETSNISNETNAYINDSTVYSKNKTLVQSESEEKIDAIIVSGAVSGTLAIAGSALAININNTNDAYVTDSYIYSDKDIEISSQDNTYLGEENGLLVGSVAASGGGGVGASVIVTNITQDVNSFATNSDINAKEASTIKANSSAITKTYAGTVGAGVYGGAAGSVTINTIDSSTQAYTSDININQEEDYKGSNSQTVSILADSTNTITSLPGSISGSLGASLSGSLDLATIYNTTSANLGSNTTLYSGGDLSVEATSTKKVTSTVVAGTVTGGVGIAGAVSIININSNLSDEAIEAVGDTQDSTNGNLTDSLDTDKLGDSSNESSTKDDLNNIDLSVDDEFSQSTSINKGVFASIGNNSSLDVKGSTNIEAKDDITTSTLSGAAAVGGLLGAGGSVNLVNIGSITEAYIGEKVTLVTDSLDIQSDLITDITSDAYAAAGGGLVGLGAAISILDIDYTSSAYIGEESDVDATSDIDIKATSDLSATSNGVGAAVGAAAAGIVESSITQEGTTQAYIANNNTTEATNIAIEASSESNLVSESTAAAGGIFGSGSGSVSSINDAATVEAYIGDNVTVVSSEDTSIIAYANAALESIAKGFAGSTGLSVGVSNALSQWTAEVTSSIGEESNINVKNLTMNAYINQNTDRTNIDNAITSESIASSGGLVGAAGATSKSENISDVKVEIGDDTIIDASKDISTAAKSYTNTKSTSKGTAGGIISAGFTSAISTNDTSASTTIGSASLTALKDIDILVYGNNASYASSIGGQGGLVGVGGTKATVNITNNVNITLNSSTLEAKKDVLLKSIGEIDSEVITSNTSIGAITTNVSESNLTIDQNININLNNAKITADNITLKAKGEGLTATSYSYTKTIAADSTSRSNSNLDVNSDTNINISGSSSLLGYKSIIIQSLQKSLEINNNAQSTIEAGLTGSLYSNAYSDSDINSNINIKNDASITTNDLTIEAISANRDSYVYNNTAETEAKTVVELVKTVVETLVKTVSWIPFFGDLVKWVTKKVTKWIEDVTNSETSAKTSGNYTSTSKITLNGDIHQILSSSQKLEIAEDNTITTQGDIKASIVGNTVVVDSLENTESASIALLSDSDNSSIAGDGNIFISNAYEEVEIINNSNLNLEINNIATINNDLTTPNIDITTYDNNSNFTYVSENTSSLLSIQNLGQGDITLKGNINNEIGSTTIYNAYGDIYSDNSSIITNSLNINAYRGNLGESTNYINVEFAIDDAAESTLISNSLYDTYLSLSSSKLVDPDYLSSNNVSSITLDEITADGKIDIRLKSSTVYTTAFPEAYNGTNWLGQTVVKYKYIYKEKDALSTYNINNISSSDDISISAKDGVSLVLEGSIQSGLAQRDITIEASTPLESESKYISEISADAITLADITQTGGNLSIDLTNGTLTGNGDINLLNSYTDLNIVNENSKELILNTIDTNSSVEGSFTLNSSDVAIGTSYDNINVNEIGSDVATINIESNNGGNIELNSNILNSSGTTTLSGNANLKNLVSYKILADEISLNFESASIGSSTNNIIIDGKLSASANDNIYISSVNDLLINNIMADNVYLNSAGKIESLNTNTIDIQANTLSLIANDKIGASNNFLDLSTDTLSANSTLGDINITNDKSLEIVNNGLLAENNIQLEVEGTLTQVNDADIISSSKKVSIEADGNIILDFIKAATSIFIDSKEGSIAQNGNSDINITSDTLTLQAKNGIGNSDSISLAVNKIDVDNESSNNIALTNNKNLVLSNIKQEGGDFKLEVAGTLTQQGNTDISAKGNIDLVAVNDISLGNTSSDASLNIESSAGSFSQQDTTNISSAGDLNINALNDISLGNTNSSDNIIITSSTGSLTQQDTTDISATNDITLNSESDISLGNTTSDADISITSTDGSFTQQDTTDIIAKGNIDIDVLNDISLGNTSSDKNITLTSSDGSFIQEISSNITALGNIIINTLSDISLGNTSSDASINIASSDGSFTQQDNTDISAKGNINLVAVNDISLGDTSSQANLNIESSSGSFTQQDDTNIYAKGNIDIEASKYILVGDIQSEKKISLSTQDYLTQKDNTEIEAKGDLEFLAESDISLGKTTSDANISITSSAASFTQQDSTDIIAKGNLSINAKDDISLGNTSSGANLDIESSSGSFTQQDSTNIYAKGNIDITASKYILVGDIQSEKKISLSTQDYLTQKDNTEIEAKGDIELLAKSDISLGKTTSDANISISSSAGSFTQQTKTSTLDTDIKAKGNINIDALNDISLGNTSSNKNLTVISSGGSFIQEISSNISAIGNIIINTLNDISLGNTSSDANISITSSAASFTQQDATDIIANGNINISAFTDISLGNTSSEKSLSLKAINGTFTQQNNTNISSKGDMNLEASNDILLGDVSSNASVTLKSNKGAFTQASGTNIYAKKDILVETLNNISIFDINSDSNITLHSKNGNISASGGSSKGLYAKNSLSIYADSGIVGSLHSPIYVTEGNGGISIIANGIENYVSAMIAGYSAPENDNVDQGLAIFNNKPTRGEMIEDYYKATNSITSASSSQGSSSFVASSSPSTTSSKGSSLVNMPNNSEASGESEGDSEEDSK